jgi:hypothetical protein
MIAPSLKHLENRLPAEPKNFLFSTQPFGRLEDSYLFSRIYPVLIGNLQLDTPSYFYYKIDHTGSVCVDGDGDNALSLKAWYDRKQQCIRQTAETSALAKWFKSRLDLRIAKPFKDRLLALSMYGLSWQEIVEILFFQGFNDLITLDPFLYDLLENKSETPMKKYEWEQFLKNRYTTMFDMEIGSCEEKHFSADGKGIVRLSCLSPDQLDFIIRKMPAGLINDTAEKDMISKVTKTWEKFRDTLKIWDLQEFNDWYRSRSVLKTKNVKPDYLPVMERMTLTEDGFNLCFMSSGEKIWYCVNPHTGRIKTRNDKKGCLKTVHFALKKAGKARGKMHRGKHDILVAFVKNAVKYCSKQDPVYLNDIALKEMIWEKLDQLANSFLDRLDSECVDKARELSNRYAIAWEVFGIVKRYHKNSMEIQRLDSFAMTFPTLFKIIYPGFLTEYIVPGKSLKKNIPYWSKYVREQAQISPKNYTDAKSRIMKAVAVTLGVSATIDDKTFQDALGIVHFNLPFQKQPRYKEAYLVWMLKQDQFDGHTFRSWYDYIESKQYIVDRYTSKNSLKTRHDQWLLDELKNNSGASRTFFPSPWLKAEWVMDDYHICYIPDSLNLHHHAEIQQNCSASYAPAICANKIQLYALKLQDEIVGTIEVKIEKDRIVLGHCAGYQNGILTREQLQVVDVWFPYHSDKTDESEYEDPDCDIPF